MQMCILQVEAWISAEIQSEERQRPELVERLRASQHIGLLIGGDIAASYGKSRSGVAARTRLAYKVGGMSRRICAFAALALALELAVRRRTLRKSR
jgi:hypothetical protein